MTNFHLKKRINRIKKEKNINNKKYKKQMNINIYRTTTFPIFTIIQQYFKFVYTFFEICVKIISGLKKYIVIFYIYGGRKMIERTTKIGELLKIAPEKATILLEAGMHCLGCPASQNETLEEACDVHGIDVEEILKKLND